MIVPRVEVNNNTKLWAPVWVANVTVSFVPFFPMIYQAKTPLNEVKSSGEHAFKKNFWYQQLWRKMILHSIK